MNIPFTIAFSTTQTSTPYFFIEDAAKPTLVRSVTFHNEHSGNQTLTLTYKAGYADTIGIGTNYDFYTPTVAAKTTEVWRDLIIVNPGDSLGAFGDGNLFNCIVNCVVL